MSSPAKVTSMPRPPVTIIGEVQHILPTNKHQRHVYVMDLKFDCGYKGRFEIAATTQKIAAYQIAGLAELVKSLSKKKKVGELAAYGERHYYFEERGNKLYIEAYKWNRAETQQVNIGNFSIEYQLGLENLLKNSLAKSPVKNSDIGIEFERLNSDVGSQEDFAEISMSPNKTDADLLEEIIKLKMAYDNDSTKTAYDNDSTKIDYSYFKQLIEQLEPELYNEVKKEYADEDEDNKLRTKKAHELEKKEEEADPALATADQIHAFDDKLRQLIEEEQNKQPNRASQN